MSTASSEYWMTYLRRNDAQETHELIKRQVLMETACRVVELSEYELEQLNHLILYCEKELKDKILPIIKVPAVQTFLYNIIEELKNSCVTDETLREAFHERLKNDSFIRDFLAEALDAITTTDATPSVTYTCVEQLSKEKPTIEKVREEVKNQMSKTWRDLPPEEIAQRLSKGEILPRNEWIPGQGKERRTLNKAEVEAHLDFGLRLHNEGNLAFSQNQVELALIRYTQGVQLLNWVEGDNEEDTQRIMDLLVVFYRNQAAAALSVGDYRIAQEATTLAIKYDPNDAKALYRRAEAYIFLGQLPLAKNDYVTILKSPYSSTSARMAAKQGLLKIRSIVSKWKTDVKEFVPLAIKDVTFSEKRITRKPYAQASIDESQTGPTKRQRSPKKYNPVTWETLSLVFCCKTMIEGIKNCIQDYHPALLEEDVEILLENILKRYTEGDIQKEIKQLCRSADFEEKRILILARPFLARHLEEILSHWESLGDTFEKMQKNFLLCLASYHTNPILFFLLKYIYVTILGDSTEIDV